MLPRRAPLRLALSLLTSGCDDAHAECAWVLWAASADRAAGVAAGPIVAQQEAAVRTRGRA